MTSGHPAHKPAEVSNCEGEKDNSWGSCVAEDKPTESIYMHVTFFT